MSELANGRSSRQVWARLESRGKLDKTCCISEREVSESVGGFVGGGVGKFEGVKVGSKVGMEMGE